MSPAVVFLACLTAEHDSLLTCQSFWTEIDHLKTVISCRISFVRKSAAVNPIKELLMKLDHLFRFTVLASTSGLMLLMPLDAAKAQAPSSSAKWNYFGACASDDVIYAENGRYYYMNYGRDIPTTWKYGGSYRRINGDSIAIPSKNRRNPLIYWHQRVASLVCTQWIKISRRPQR